MVILLSRKQIKIIAISFELAVVRFFNQTGMIQTNKKEL